MAQASCARSWELRVERGPDWLFVRPCQAGTAPVEAAYLAEQIWSLLEQNFTYRLVLELAETEQLDSLLIEQLLWLEQQTRSHGGMLRLCGLSPANQALLEEADLGNHFAAFCDREAAVMGRSLALRPR
ncbi:MAG TPA: STAS domain-containing protein [Pirellulales bacterium]|jgi:anti-anti-sigma regulatory factor|nr:STAS domain-containing protein [Pirellulales bacterium]